MRPPRLLFLAFCLIFFPIFLIFYSVLTTTPRVSTPTSFAGQTTGLHALFSFNLPSSLFPPSAIISLTDENATFFLARPAAFGPLLPNKGLSGQLWVASGFGERSPEAGMELGCSDIPGWGEGDTHGPTETRAGKPSLDDKDAGLSQSQRHADFLQNADTQSDSHTGAAPPPTNDGTDDHLHHPLPESVVADPSTSEKNRDSPQIRQSAHADIQSLQESAEISGRVVLLSRGGCGFLEKVKWAQRRGAVALIVGDDTRGGNLVTMYARGDTSNVTIPSLFTSYTTAHLLSSLIPPQDRGESTGIEGNLASGNSEKESTTGLSSLPSPFSSSQAAGDNTTPESNSGFFHKLFSWLGLGCNERSGRQLEENRRPPSSGNINWIPVNHWDDQEQSPGDSGYAASAGTDNKNRKGSKTNTGSVEGDNFVIGVQDWRDPDLVPAKSSAVAVPTETAGSESKPQSNEKGTQPTASLKGGSITPGSGEYHAVGKSIDSGDSTQKKEARSSASTGSEAPGNKANWFYRHIIGKGERSSSKTQQTRDVPKKQTVKTKEHEGLWVTLTPTSMSTSPFFDTLLVLIISPLLTLSVVYILLLLRSRIRRRRWRAPKSLVERLPVRTYHTIPTSSSSSSSLRSLSPGPVSQTSPLLGVKGPAENMRSRPQPSSEPRSFESKREQSGASTTWRRKYTGRQVECVVCLEEYVDGQSRVMSLPCGHEFHAECITPWLTTRRRTCPICKGDVVRSMSLSHHPDRDVPETEAESHRGAASAPVPITAISEDEMSDLERHASTDTGLERHATSTPPGWRNFAALSFSALSGDTIWHQGRPDNEH
ncbi:hypothetical protein BJY01DRAFT_124680 [Aspergillus pseudoustus]|uniref:RING-type E3 ubiquitin transferase n=1 Tax=Aspergillus pseudoustus TaxID=1810923 RepID=A0ABR4INN7_9EURO